MITISANVFGLVADFRGAYAPFQAIHIEPHPQGGVIAMATKNGHAACVARDPSGHADEERTILPSDELLKAAKPIKSADRFLVLSQATVTVTTRYAKSPDKSIELALTDSSKTFPALRLVFQQCLQRWSACPELSSTVGRYDSDLLLHAIKAAGGSSSLVISAYDGGPLRLQSESLEAVILVMPQTATPIPTVPEWLLTYALDQ